MGTRTQNVLTLAKVVGLAALIIVGFFWADPEVTVRQSHVHVEGAWDGSTRRWWHSMHHPRTVTAT